MSRDFGPDIFLHGVCGVFALALHERYGYVIRLALDDEDGEDAALSHPWDYLIHCFCVSESGRYIDVRGVMDSEQTLMTEFSDLFDEYVITPADAAFVKDRVGREMTQAELDGFLSEANRIILASPERYRT